jgi:hypothetical protein
LKFKELFEAKKQAPWSPGYYVTHVHTREVIDGPHQEKGAALNASRRWVSGAVHYTDGKSWTHHEGSTEKLKPFKAPY